MGRNGEENKGQKDMEEGDTAGRRWRRKDEEKGTNRKGKKEERKTRKRRTAKMKKAEEKRERERKNE